MKMRINKAYNLLQYFLSLFVRQAAFSKEGPCILIACHDTNRYAKCNGKWFSPILEPMAEYYRRLGIKIIHLSYPPTFDSFTKVYGDSIYINRSLFCMKIIKMIELLIFGQHVSEIRFNKRMASVYKKIITITSPRIILSITTPVSMANAAHDLAIPLIEPHHGMNTKPDRDLMIEMKFGIPELDLPNIFLSFDETTQETLRSIFQGQSTRSLLMPHPWHVEALRTESKLISNTNSQRSSNIFATGKSLFLVTLAWGYDGELDYLCNIIPNGILHPSIERAIAMTPKNIMWLMRLHPIQLKDKAYRHHRDYVYELPKRFNNVDVDIANSLPLPLLLQRCCGHISMMSGVCGEAALMGVPSLMLCPTLKPGGVLEGCYSEFSSEVVTFGNLVAEEIAAWVVAHAENVALNKYRAVNDQKLFENQLDKLLDGSLV